MSSLQEPSPNCNSKIGRRRWWKVDKACRRSYCFSLYTVGVDKNGHIICDIKIIFVYPAGRRWLEIRNRRICPYQSGKAINRQSEVYGRFLGHFLGRRHKFDSCHVPVRDALWSNITSLNPCLVLAWLSDSRPRQAQSACLKRTEYS